MRHRTVHLASKYDPLNKLANKFNGLLFHFTPLYRKTSDLPSIDCIRFILLVSRADELGLVIPAKDKSRILGHQSSVLARQAAGIVATVRSLSDTLHQHKRQYLDTNIGGGASSMTEPERNQVIQSTYSQHFVLIALKISTQKRKNILKAF